MMRVFTISGMARFRSSDQPDLFAEIGDTSAAEAPPPDFIESAECATPKPSHEHRQLAIALLSGVKTSKYARDPQTVVRASRNSQPRSRSVQQKAHAVTAERRHAERTGCGGEAAVTGRSRRWGLAGTAWSGDDSRRRYVGNVICRVFKNLPHLVSGGSLQQECWRACRRGTGIDPKRPLDEIDGNGV